MKATEYIDKFQKLVNEHGDFDVHVDFNIDDTFNVTSPDPWYDVDIDYFEDDFSGKSNYAKLWIDIRMSR